MSKLSFRARALDASKPMPIFLAEDLPDLPDYSAINRAVPQMPSGMEKEEECEHHLQRAICTGLIIPTPEVCQVEDLEFYEQCYPSSYKMPKQHIHMQPLWQEQEAPEYDIDSEDDRWLKQQRHPELTELKFEQMMDKLERSSGQTVVTLNEAKLLLERQDDLVIAVYDYWLNKRLKTQHPLIVSVRTENRAGQSANNPYLAFRRRTEKMQTRKNRKNDESSYEKMLKLRRDLARALTLLELVARRERAKRDLLKMTALLADKRYAAGDFAGQLLAEIPQSRPTYSAAALAAQAASFRREALTPLYAAPAPRVAPPTELARPREKRPYKRRKYRHHPPAGSVRDSGVYTSSEEEGAARAGAGTPPDDGPFAFKRKAGCFYEMPTATLYGDPVDPENTSKDALFEHEIDVRHRYTLTSLRRPAARCAGFCRRRRARGGRVALDRARAPALDLWRTLTYDFHNSTSYKAERKEEVELETERHRYPKEMVRDYHSTKKYPWRYAFRRHLKHNPDMWTSGDVKTEKMDCDDSDKVNSDISDVKLSDKRTVLDETVRGNLVKVLKKRGWESDTDSSYDSDASLQPVEQEFEKIINKVNNEWLHFRPKTPPPFPPTMEQKPTEHELQLAADTPFTVELASAGESPFTTTEFTLTDLYGDLNVEDISGDDLLNENLGLTEAQVESILSDTDLKSLAEVDLVRDDKKTLSEDLLEELVLDAEQKDPFLCSRVRRRGERASFGSSVVTVTTHPDSEPIFIDTLPIIPPKPPTPPPKLVKQSPVKIKEEVKKETLPAAPAPTPPPPVTVREPVSVPIVKVEARRSTTTLEEHSPAPGVQLKTVHTRHSPLKKHIITARREPPQPPQPAPQPPQASPQPPPLRATASDTLKVRLQNHLLSGAAGVEVSAPLQNGPFVAAPAREIGTVSVSVAPSPSPRRSGTPLLLTPALHPRPPTPATSKLKVLHAHPLTQTQRTQLLAAHSRAAQLAALPTVVSTQLQLKTAPGSVTQFFEIKSGQLGKGPHLVNVVRQPQPGKTVARLDLNDAKKRQVVATFDGTLKGNIATATRPHRVSVSLDGRQIVRAALPSVRAPVRHQIQLKNRTLVATPQLRTVSEAPTSITIAAPAKTASIPSSVVANLLQKNVQIPKPGQKIAISAGQALAANVQAIAFSAAQLKARQARLIAQPRTQPVTAEIVEATPSTSASADGQCDGTDGTSAGTNGAVRRRAADTLPMEVT